MKRSGRKPVYWVLGEMPNGKKIVAVTADDETPDDLPIVQAWDRHVENGGTLTLPQFIEQYGDAYLTLRGTDPRVPEMLETLGRIEREN